MSKREDGDKVDSSKDDLGKIEKDSDDLVSCKVTEVVLDSCVLLNLLQRSFSEHDTVSGVLLGLNKKHQLEITYSFPLPRTSRAHEGKRIKINRFQTKMLKVLRHVNVDNNIVGWYQTSFHASYLSLESIQQHFVHQKFFRDKSIMLVIDVPKTKLGHLGIHAFRLSKKFMDYLRDTQKNRKVNHTNIKHILNDIEKKVLSEGLPHSVDRELFAGNDLTKSSVFSKDIFEEVPIRIRNLALVENFLKRYEDKLNVSHFECFDTPGASKNIDMKINTLLAAFKEFQNEKFQFRYNLKKKRYDNLLDLMLLSNQIQDTGKDLAQSTSTYLTDLFLQKELMHLKEGGKVDSEDEF